MNAVDKEELDLNQIVWTTVAYVAADLNEKIPLEPMDTGDSTQLVASCVLLIVSAVLVKIIGV